MALKIQRLKHQHKVFTIFCVNEIKQHQENILVCLKKRLFFKSQCVLLKFDTHNYWIPYEWDFQLGTYHSGNKMENDLA